MIHIEYVFGAAPKSRLDVSSLTRREVEKVVDPTQMAVVKCDGHQR
jgi:hypothetical protein